MVEVLLISRPGLNLQNLDLFCPTFSSLGVLFLVLSPTVGVFPPFSSTFTPAPVPTEASIFPCSTACPSSGMECRFPPEKTHH